MNTNSGQERKRIAILGSTGSIGTQSLEVIASHPDIFEVEVLTANNNVDLLIGQAKQFQPNAVVIGNSSKYSLVAEALRDEPIKVYAGEDALNQVVQMETIDLVIAAMVGYAGVMPVWHAVNAGRHVALANKEALVVAGEQIINRAKQKQVDILPVDSEHSAIFQCLIGEIANPIEKIYLTCSGGPFREKTLKELEHVTVEDALAHPSWDMGAKITIDSATLMNKGFEAIEAHWLFGVGASKIDVIVHPQSVIHSMVQFEDGSIKAQLGVPDMKLPIQYAMGFPYRLKNNFPRFNFLDYPELHFGQPDTKIFRNLALAYNALEKGGNMPCMLNAANEVVVQAFLEKRITFLQMSDIIEQAIDGVTFVKQPTMDDLVSTNTETRKKTQQLTQNRF